ncbi:MAG: hypothetical protein HKN87_04145 [Saprospiraceae bacterium]|nr:hypothetical protein [Saprospiraceae bacterium]
MDNARKNIWYQKSIMIDCSIEDINKSLNNLGEHYEELMTVYPGMTTVELIEHDRDYVTIKTNEGLMKRTNISVTILKDKTLVEFDEEYITSKLTTNSHFVEIFKDKNNNTELNLEISNLTAPGFLGFFLRNFGSKNIGNGFLDSYRKILEKS